MQIGDIALVRGHQSAVSTLIRVGAAVGKYKNPGGAWQRYPAEARKFTHAALIVSDTGDIVEAVARGVRPAHISKYDQADLLIIPMGADEHDRGQILAFADAVVAAHFDYGYFSFAACGVNCLLAHFKHRLVYFGVDHTKICSAFCADAVRPAGVTWWKSEPVTMPADIFVQFGHLAGE